MTEQEIYQEIGQLLWSIMPNEAKTMFCVGNIYPTTSSYGFEWLKVNNEKSWFDFKCTPQKIGDKILDLMRNLQQTTNGEKWTHFTISLDENTNFKIEFAYIPEEDHWPGLEMKGISDITKEEAKQQYMPLELWEERVKLKKQK